MRGCCPKLWKLGRRGVCRLRIFTLSCDELTCEGAMLVGCGLAAGVNSSKVLRLPKLGCDCDRECVRGRASLMPAWWHKWWRCLHAVIA